MGSGSMKPAGRRPPLEISGYRIGAELGKGTTGLVYRAEQVATDRVVALKVLRPELAKRRHAIRRLQREVRTTARLNHPNIVSALDMGESDGLWWYAMELVEGPSMLELIQKEGQLTERKALRLFLPLADALKHTSQVRVVHRDIKPGNILVDGSGRPWLVDLGLAFADDDPMLTKTGATLGTPHYVSPEQARNPQLADIRSDLWSLGATFYHALCGRPPFQGESVAEILSGVLYSRIPDPRELNPKLSKDMALVLRKCLARDPGMRYSSPEELLRDLELIRERRHVHIERRSLDPVLKDDPPVWMRPLLVVAGALSVAILAIFLAEHFVVGSPEADPIHEGFPLTAFEPLEEILQRAQQDPSYIGKAQVDVLDVERELPSQRHVARWERVKAELGGLFNAQVIGDVNRLPTDIEDLLTPNSRFPYGDFSGAHRLVDGFEVSLQRKYGLQRKQLESALSETEDLETFRADINRRLDEAIGNLRLDVLNLFDATVTESIERALERNHWADAQDALVSDIGQWMRSQPSLSTAGFPADPLETLYKDLTDLVCERESKSLAQAWGVFDAKLEGFVRAQSADILLVLTGDDRQAALEWLGDGDAGDRLESLFDGHLAGLGIPRSQLLDLEGTQVHRALRESRAAVLEAETELRLEVAEDWWSETDSKWAAFLLPSERRYEIALQRWTDLLAELPPVAEPVRDRVVRARLTAQLLSDYLEAVVVDLKALDGLELKPGAFVVGGIGHFGILDVGYIPLEQGFWLRSTVGTRETELHFALRPIPSPEPGAVAAPSVIDAKAFASVLGIPEEYADIESEHLRLQHALFLFHEGLPLEAGEVLESGDLPEEGPYLDLIANLEDRVGGSRAQDRLIQVERERKAEGALKELRLSLRGPQGESLNIEQWLADPSRVRAMKDIRDREALSASAQALIDDYRTTRAVQGYVPDLERLIDRLSRPAYEDPVDELRDLYRPKSIERTDREDRVRMDFEFGEPASDPNQRAVGAWSRPEGWGEDYFGWYSPIPFQNDDALKDRHAWPSLRFQPPLDISSYQDTKVVFTLGQLSGSGDPDLLLISCAGWHVGFKSIPRPRNSMSFCQWTTGGHGDLERLVDNLGGSNNKDDSFPGFLLGREYRIQLVLKSQRGALDVRIHQHKLPGEGGPVWALFWQEELNGTSPDRPGEDKDHNSILVRSREPVRLHAVEIESRMRPR